MYNNTALKDEKSKSAHRDIAYDRHRATNRTLSGCDGAMLWTNLEMWFVAGHRSTQITGIHLAHELGIGNANTRMIDVNRRPSDVMS